MEEKMKKLLLTDGNAMLFRAYWATAGRPMTTRQGIPTNAVFGFASMIQKAIDTVSPDAVLIAFDAGKHTFRHDLYPDYKGGRRETPEDLVPQFAMARDFLDAFPIKWVEMQDIEADDLIGTMSKKYPEYETVILTSDRDLLQLIDDTTSVLLMRKGITEMDIMTPETLKEQMGITPSQIIDLKGLMGDKSDNIPGIPGVGEKTAMKLLGEYGTVENVLAHADELKGALQKKIIEGRESAELSKKLATIRRDVDLDFTAEDCQFKPDYKTLVRFLKTLDMNMLAAKYESLSNTEKATADEHKDAAGVKVHQVPENYYNSDIAVFCDDDRQHFYTAAMHGISLTDGKDSCFINIEDLKKDTGFRQYATDPKHRLIGFDIKRFMHLLEKEGLEIHFTDDVMIKASLYDSTLTGTDKIRDAFSLSVPVSYEEVYGKPSQPKLLVEEDKQCAYACAEAGNIMKIFMDLEKRKKDPQLEELYEKVEMPLTFILKKLETEGVYCEIGILDEIATRTYEKILLEQEAIHKAAGREFNINSPKQLSEILYDDLGLPSGKKRSTSADVLEKLSGIHPIIDHILVYRKLSKIYSTYAEGLKKYIQKDGKIHTIYNQCATQTGRLSSSEPNLQNISVRDEQGKEIRKAFLPSPGNVLISSDYHQVELRILAHMADEPSLIDAFRKGIDIHTKTAMDVFGVDQEDVTGEMRRQAKVVNFGIVYGMSDFGLAEQLGVSRKEASSFISTYYEKYPGIRTYMQSLVDSCEKNGYVKTLSGRRREIPEIKDRNRMVREFGKRAAMNAPIQGTAADLIKLAMIHIDKAMSEAGVKSRMILQVHDELIFDVPKEETEQMKELIRTGMEQAMELKVPLTVECSVGSDWYEAK